jgi:hypothetical protein
MNTHAIGSAIILFLTLGMGIHFVVYIFRAKTPKKGNQ